MDKITVEKYSESEWLPAATLSWDDTKNRCEMDILWGSDSHSVSLGLHPEDTFFHWKQDNRSGNAIIPPFLYDLLPQGSARDSMLQILHLTSRDARADLPILMSGAVNPIGNLRLSSAVKFWKPMLDDAKLHKDRYRFTTKQVVDRDEEFVEAMRLFGFIASGGGSIQGASPKFLLTKDQDGYFMPDLMADDHEAYEHYIVKYPRSKHESDAAILKHEVMYMQVADRLGLRSSAPPVTIEDSLWMHRFDRAVDPNGVIRLHQESIMSVAGLAGFGQSLTHESVLRILNSRASHPDLEILEYIKRDMLNVVVGNTDNHGRNTALQVTQDGDVQMTPVFDIAPMFMDREAIPRQTRWDKTIESQAGLVDWTRVADVVADDYGYTVHNPMDEFKNQLNEVPRMLSDLGAEPKIIERSKRGLGLLYGDEKPQSSARVKP